MAQKSHQITGQVVVNLDVPKNKHGIIIGKQGANIRDLQVSEEKKHAVQISSCSPPSVFALPHLSCTC